METIIETIPGKNEQLSVSYCNIDKLYYIRRNEQDVHHQQTKPTETELLEAYHSDQWKDVFNAMAAGERVRVSERIYHDLMECVPPIYGKKSGSFYCGEAYSHNSNGATYHYFETVEGKRYGQIKNIER